MNFQGFIFSNAFILLFLPIWVAFLITLNFAFPSFKSKNFTTGLTLASTGICAIYSVCLLVVTAVSGAMINENIVDWIVIEDVSFSFGFLLDNLSALMLTILTVVGFFVQLYSISEVKEDNSFYRFFICLNLLNFSMAGLIVSTNLLQTFVFSALVGLCSYLLISFNHSDSIVSKKSKKYLISNISADFCLLSAIIIFIYFAYFGIQNLKFVTLNYSNLLELSTQITPYISEKMFLVIPILLFISILIKTAQFPFEFLFIKNKTRLVAVDVIILVTPILAGVLLFQRLLPIYNLTGIMPQIISCVAIITIFLGAFLSIFQTNIKAIIASIATSFAGMIFFAIISSAISSGLFLLSVCTLLITLLYFISGKIIDLYGGNENIFKMGGLRKQKKYLAILAILTLLSTTSLGVGCFYPVKQVLSNLLSKEMMFEYYIVITALFFIGFASSRLYFNVFEGEEKELFTDKSKSLLINIPIFSLIIPVLFLGFIFNDSFNALYEVVFNYDMNITDILIILGVILFGIIVAAIDYKVKFTKYIPKIIKKYIEEDFYIEEICSYLVEKFIIIISTIVNFIDNIVKSIYKIIEYIVKITAYMISKIHEDTLQHNLLFSLFGILLTLCFIASYYWIIIPFYYWIIGEVG